MIQRISIIAIILISVIVWLLRKRALALDVTRLRGMWDNWYPDDSDRWVIAPHGCILYPLPEVMV